MSIVVRIYLLIVLLYPIQKVYFEQSETKNVDPYHLEKKSILFKLSLVYGNFQTVS